MLKVAFTALIGAFFACTASAGQPNHYHPMPPVVLEADADSSHNWDAIHYELQLQVTPLAVPDSLFIEGGIRVFFTPEVSGLDTVDLHLMGLEVTGVQLMGAPCNYTRVDCLLYVALPEPHNPGEELYLDIDYSGVPLVTGELLGGVGIHYPSSTMIYTHADPRGARNWMPCWDEPWDKATIRQQLILPSSFVVAANGELEFTLPLGENTLWVFFMNQPIATYLISFCASNYATFEQSADSVAIKHYVYPQHLAAAQVDFQNVPEMIETFSGYFGPYPFTTFGYAEAPIFGGGGAMENQTMVTYGSLLFTGTGLYEDVAAHELAHQWFGDAVGYLDWPEMWLSEGFATYSEALWHEHTEGPTGYLQTVTQIQQTYLGWESQTDPHPMYDPPWDVIWSPLTYEKGASVLHMLRYEVGDSAFFATLQNYTSEYLYGNASTGDLAEIVQQVSGQDYNWFFDQWVYESGYPTFEYIATWQPQGDQTLLTLSVAQTQPETFALFRADADLYIFAAGDTTIEEIAIEDQPVQEIEILLSVEPDSVRLDPQSWVLGYKIRRDDLTAPILEALNPLIADDGGDGFLDPGESGDLSFVLQNSGLPSDSLILELTCNDPELVILEWQRSAPPLGFYGEYDLSADPFVVENAPGSDPRWVDFQVQVDEALSGDPVATLWFSLPVGTPDLLLVDDDGGGIAQLKHQQVLNNLERVYRTVVYVAADSLPPLDDYLGVLWCCGQQQVNTLTAADQTLLQNYLDLGGSLLLSGRGVVPDLSATAFFQNTLHAQEQGTTPVVVLNGADPLLQGLSFFISGDGSNQDIVEPDGSPGSGRLLTYYTGQGGAVKYDGAYKTCLLGFGFEDVQGGNPNFAEPEELLGPVLAWFSGEVGVKSDPEVHLPIEYSMGQNYPNPFNAQTVIPIALPQRSQITVTLYNLMGQRVGTVYQGIQNAGQGRVHFNASFLSSGVYFYRVEATGLEQGGEFADVGKMLLVK